MKLGINEITEGIYQAALNRTIRQLELEGFTVEQEYLFKRANIRVNLFAKNNDEKRIYEFKFGKNRIQRNRLARLQDFAKSIGARLYVIYLEMPQSKEIVFDGIENIIYGHLNEYPPQEICELTTHFYIENVENVEISSIEVTDEVVRLSGSGCLIVDLQFGSHHDRRHSDAVNEIVEFEFTFRLKLDVSKQSILYSYYKFDIGWYYEDN